MAHHDYSDTVSEPPLSPFSNRSFLSDGTQTSDEPADLGAFTSVFRVMHQLQAQQQPIPVPVRSTPSRPESRTTERSDSDYETDDDEEASVAWSHTLIDSYMDNHSVHSGSNPGSPRIRANGEREDEDGFESSDTEGMYEDGIDENGRNVLAPSLGDLDSALGFLAAEQAKFTASQDVRSHSSTGESAWRHVVEPRRKRRRKRKGIPGQSPNIEDGKLPLTVVPTPETSSSSLESSSSPGKVGISPPAREPTLASTKAHRVKPRQLSHSRLTQQNLFIPSSSSSPPHSNVVHSLPTAIDLRLTRLRALALKVQHQYPQNAFRLKQLLRHGFPSSNITDPRGPEPGRGDPLTHVFIDHSNILVGFINHWKRTRKPSSGKPLLYFPALTLILERGRLINRRVLATSSPLYQNMDSAKELGYEVHVYVRVPEQPQDATSGTDHNASTNDTSSTNGPSALGLGLKNVKQRKPVNVPTLHTNTPPSVSVSGRASIESDPGHSPITTPRVINDNIRPQGHARSTSIPSSANISISSSFPSATSMAGSANLGRVRYREQGVDELLQLKLHQALLSPDADPLPAGATIVLATGDGASGQFNEDGFVGAIRTALNKGWRVELYGWASGISNLWWKVKDEEGKEGRLLISTIDHFAGDLLEL